jgi:ppGpp synthetase/RelA/SpoT-type nucleotidyltranferase
MFVRRGVRFVPLSRHRGPYVQKYSISQVKNAGKIIAAFNPHPPSDQVRAAFQLAHDWRTAHIVPMRSARTELKAIARQASVETETAGRLKRFQSIRRKLRRRPQSLYAIQDIAGCRAIVGSVEAVDTLAAFYRARGSRYELLDEDNYIAAPKPGGYRSVHFVIKYVGDEALTGGNRLTVEVQIRTRLQHGWATAVEAVGTVRNEELKGGIGDRDWLRFFEIMAAEFAVEEGRSIVPTVTVDARERLAELKELEKRLDAIATLESYKKAIRQVDDFGNLPGSSFLVVFNSVDRSVTVRANPSFLNLAAQYQIAERQDSSNAVVVEVDRVDDLISAYPNYFLDVTMFTDRLRSIIAGGRRKHIGALASSDEWLAAWVARSKHK